MNSGPLLQLIARGEEDIHLSDKPETTIFSSNFKRFTPFSLVHNPIIFNDKAENFGQKLTCIIPRYGDLVTNMYLQFQLPALSIPAGSTYVGWTNSLGYIIMNEIEIQINGQTIDRQYGDFMEIWDEFTSKVPNLENNYLVGKFSTLTNLQQNAANISTYTVPLNFWFCKNYALALPLISMAYSEIKIVVCLKPFSECVIYDGPTAPPEVQFIYMRMLSEVAFLSDDLRRSFATISRKYLIEQVQNVANQIYPTGTTTMLTPLNIQRPVKELFWIFREIDSEQNNDWVNFAQRVTMGEPVVPLGQTFKLLINGVNRFSETDESYFRLVQPWQYHKKLPSEFVYCYNFGTTPEDIIQPTGTIDFTMINDTSMYIEMASSFFYGIPIPSFRIEVYAKNYNWLVIKNGIAGLAYF